jgi:hypothetical protein
MSPNRGCFERHDDACDAHEYASSPCYMHEVDPSYFGWLPSTPPISDRRPIGPKAIVNAGPKARRVRNAILAWPRLRRFIRALSRSIVRAVARQIERVEARREIQAIARLRSRHGSAR